MRECVVDKDKQNAKIETNMKEKRRWKDRQENNQQAKNVEEEEEEKQEQEEEEEEGDRSQQEGLPRGPPWVIQGLEPPATFPHWRLLNASWQFWNTWLMSSIDYFPVLDSI